MRDAYIGALSIGVVFYRIYLPASTRPYAFLLPGPPGPGSLQPAGRTMFISRQPDIHRYGRKRKTGAGPEICVIFSTVPASKSRDIARALLDRHLVACVNMTPVRSWYRWKGEFCDDGEHLLILKTRKELAETVIRN